VSRAATLDDRKRAIGRAPAAGRPRTIAARPRATLTHRTAAGRPLDVALVNNMPDAAFQDTERQFRAMLASTGRPVRLRLHVLASVRRSPPTAALIAQRYRGAAELRSDPPDALIVTGTEPSHPELSSEPYWPELARLLEWATGEVPIVVASCLAAHAALLLFDGIHRERRPAKCCGVFSGAVCRRPEALGPAGALVAGLPDSIPLPHSRLNDTPQPALIDAGWRIVVGDGGSGAGWAVAAREVGGTLFVLCQAHPEYGRLSLLREYRRDVRRWLLEGAAAYPALPSGYLDARGTRALERFAERARAGAESPGELWRAFPFDRAAAGVRRTWGAPSALLYANWVAAAGAAALAA